MCDLILLPVNVVRLIQILRLIQSISAAPASDLPVHSLLPFMSHRFVSAGQVLMSKGDKADLMYYLVKSQMKVRELGKTIESGAILGEIGIFARDQTRMATIVCVTDCELYEMSESKAKQLFFQDRSFGLAVLQLIIGRLLENLKLLQSTPEGDQSEGVVARTQNRDPGLVHGEFPRVGAI